MCVAPRELVVRKSDGEYQRLTLGCGHCYQCAMQYSNMWALRIIDESRKYDATCFVTLTYSPEHLPDGGTLVKRDVQLWLKRLRKAIEPIKIRYYLCGEYGSKGQRPHYHVIIFGWRPSDLVPLRVSRKGEQLYNSDIIVNTWGKGFVSVGDLSMRSVKYCAKYLNKLNPVLPGRLKPFVLMSRRPGIGDYVDPSRCKDGVVYVDGIGYPVPRYYIDRMDRDGYVDVAQGIKDKRVNYSSFFAQFPQNCEKIEKAIDNLHRKVYIDCAGGDSML